MTQMHVHVGSGRVPTHCPLFVSAATAFFLDLKTNKK